MATVAKETHRWTNSRYHRIAEANILGPADKVELLDGRIVFKLDHCPWAADQFDAEGVVPARPWTPSEHRQLLRRGILDPDDSVEIVDPSELPVMVQYAPHPTSVSLCGDALRIAFGIGFLVREEKPLTLTDGWEPETDVAVVKGKARDFRTRHPRKTLVVVEAADASLIEDRTIKAEGYAKAGIEDYWIINLRDRQLEVHRQPGPIKGRKSRYGYGEVTIIGEDGFVSLLAKPNVRIAVADLLP